jgi:hypothetical protein
VRIWKAIGHVRTYTGKRAIEWLHNKHHRSPCTGAPSQIFGTGGTLSVDAVKNRAHFQRTLILGWTEGPLSMRRPCCSFLRHRKRRTFNGSLETRFGEKTRAFVCMIIYRSRGRGTIHDTRKHLLSLAADMSFTFWRCVRFGSRAC